MPGRKAAFDGALAGHGIAVHLIDGTYELFRRFYGLRRFNKGQRVGPPVRW